MQNMKASFGLKEKKEAMSIDRIEMILTCIPILLKNERRKISMLNKRILTLVFVVAFLTLLVGCYPSEPNQVPVKLIGIKVSPDTITLSLGATLQLKVTALYDDGNHGDITSDCIYVSSNTKVVPLFDDGNLIAGQSPGKATITVNYILDEIIFTDTVEVTVRADIVEEVTI